MRYVSRGALEFRTKPSEFRDLGGKYRLMAEQNRLHTLFVGSDETMVASNEGYDEEMYRISCRVFGALGSSVWQRDYALKKPIVLRDITLTHMKWVYDEVGNMDSYTAVKWWHSGMGTYDILDFVEYAKRIFTHSCRNDVPAWTFALQAERYDVVLYVRTAFLESFKRGLDILNFLRMIEKVKNSRTTFQKLRIEYNRKKRQ